MPIQFDRDGQVTTFDISPVGGAFGANWPMVKDLVVRAFGESAHVVSAPVRDELNFGVTFSAGSPVSCTLDGNTMRCVGTNARTQASAIADAVKAQIDKRIIYLREVVDRRSRTRTESSRSDSPTRLPSDTRRLSDSSSPSGLTGTGASLSASSATRRLSGTGAVSDTPMRRDTFTVVSRTRVPSGTDRDTGSASSATVSPEGARHTGSDRPTGTTGTVATSSQGRTITSPTRRKTDTHFTESTSDRPSITSPTHRDTRSGARLTGSPEATSTRRGSASVSNESATSGLSRTQVGRRATRTLRASHTAERIPTETRVPARTRTPGVPMAAFVPPPSFEGLPRGYIPAPEGSYPTAFQPRPQPSAGTLGATQQGWSTRDTAIAAGVGTAAVLTVTAIAAGTWTATQISKLKDLISKLEVEEDNPRNRALLTIDPLYEAFRDKMQASNPEYLYYPLPLKQGLFRLSLGLVTPQEARDLGHTGKLPKLNRLGLTREMVNHYMEEKVEGDPIPESVTLRAMNLGRRILNTARGFAVNTLTPGIVARQMRRVTGAQEGQIVPGDETPPPIRRDLAAPDDSARTNHSLEVGDASRGVYSRDARGIRRTPFGATEPGGVELRADHGVAVAPIESLTYHREGEADVTRGAIGTRMPGTDEPRSGVAGARPAIPPLNLNGLAKAAVASSTPRVWPFGREFDELTTDRTGHSTERARARAAAEAASEIIPGGAAIRDAREQDSSAAPAAARRDSQDGSRQAADSPSPRAPSAAARASEETPVRIDRVVLGMRTPAAPAAGLPGVPLQPHHRVVQHANELKAALEGGAPAQPDLGASHDGAGSGRAPSRVSQRSGSQGSSVRAEAALPHGAGPAPAAQNGAPTRAATPHPITSPKSPADKQPSGSPQQPDGAAPRSPTGGGRTE